MKKRMFSFCTTSFSGSFCCMAVLCTQNKSVRIRILLNFSILLCMDSCPWNWDYFWNGKCHEKVRFNSISGLCCNLRDSLTMCGTKKVGKKKRSNEHTTSSNFVVVQQEDGCSRSDTPSPLWLSLIYSEEGYLHS